MDGKKQMVVLNKKVIMMSFLLKKAIDGHEMKCLAYS
ncbi:hypothetical protein J2Y71_002120 [Bacillus pumilus]|nr:hypothetical protein [Bacillus pumilus]MDF9784883.1 hypothetical protein [Bacillus pumilus]MDR6747321.1 hypothetical protein [Bacillus pumilus]MDR7248670.1 hypothetical protein [Bacillus pumilus]SNV06869.1 Uncharacterised protein [Bacillus pumilus]